MHIAHKPLMQFNNCCFASSGITGNWYLARLLNDKILVAYHVMFSKVLSVKDVFNIR